MLKEKTDSHKKHDENTCMYDELPHVDAGIPKDSECLWALIVHLLAGLFLYFYETEFDQNVL